MQRGCLWCYPVSLSAIAAALTPQMRDTHFLKSLNVFAKLIQISAIRMPVYRYTFTAFSTEQLIQRHIRHLSFDVPQSHIHTGNRIVGDRTVSPVSILMHQLPQILYGIHISSPKQRIQIFLYYGFYCQMAIGKCGTAKAVQSRLICLHLYHDQIDALRCCADYPHSLYFSVHLFSFLVCCLTSNF